MIDDEGKDKIKRRFLTSENNEDRIRIHSDIMSSLALQTQTKTIRNDHHAADPDDNMISMMQNDENNNNNNDINGNYYYHNNLVIFYYRKIMYPQRTCYITE